MVSRNDVVTRYIAEDDGSFRAVSVEVEKLGESFEFAGKKAKLLTQAEVSEARFSQASRDVALAGDVESNLRTVGGAIGAVGGEAGRAAEGLIAVGAEFPAVVEALPRLKEAMGGMGDAAKTALSSIGVGGLVGGGALIGGLLLLKKVLDDTAESTRKAVEAHEQNLQQAQNVAEIQSLTNEELLDRRKAEQEAVAEAARQLDVATKGFTDFGFSIENVDNKLVRGFDVVDVYTDAIDEHNKALEDAEVNLSAVNEEIEKRNLLEKDNTDAILAEADAIRNLTQFRLDAMDNNAEANEKLAESLAEQREAIEAQIASLEASGNSSEAVTDKITDLNGELDTLNQKTAILRSEEVQLNQARIAANEAAKELEKEEEKLTKTREAAAKKTSDAMAAQQKVITDFILAGHKTQAADIEFRQEQVKKQADSAREAMLEEAKAGRAFRRNRRKLEKDADFLAISDLEDSFAEEKQERAIQRKEKQMQLREELAMERAEKAVALQAEQADRMAAVHQAAQATARAQDEERRLVRTANEEIARVQQNRFQREAQGYQQVEQVAARTMARIEGMFGNLLSGAGGGTRGGGILSGLQGGGLTTQDLRKALGQ